MKRYHEDRGEVIVGRSSLKRRKRKNKIGLHPFLELDPQTYPFTPQENDARAKRDKPDKENPPPRQLDPFMPANLVPNQPPPYNEPPRELPLQVAIKGSVMRSNAHRDGIPVRNMMRDPQADLTDQGGDDMVAIKGSVMRSNAHRDGVPTRGMMRDPVSVAEPITDPINVTQPIMEPTNITEPIIDPMNVTEPIMDPVLTQMELDVEPAWLYSKPTTTGKWIKEMTARPGITVKDVKFPVQQQLPQNDTMDIDPEDLELDDSDILDEADKETLDTLMTYINATEAIPVEKTPESTRVPYTHEMLDLEEAELRKELQNIKQEWTFTHYTGRDKIRRHNAADYKLNKVNHNREALKKGGTPYVGEIDYSVYPAEQREAIKKYDELREQAYGNYELWTSADHTKRVLEARDELKRVLQPKPADEQETVQPVEEMEQDVAPWTTGQGGLDNPEVERILALLGAAGVPFKDLLTGMYDKIGNGLSWLKMFMTEHAYATSVTLIAVIYGINFNRVNHKLAGLGNLLAGAWQILVFYWRGLVMKSQEMLQVIRGIHLPAVGGPAWAAVIYGAQFVDYLRALVLPGAIAVPPPNVAPDAVPNAVPDVIPDVVPDVVPNAVPDAVPDVAPDVARWAEAAARAELEVEMQRRAEDLFLQGLGPRPIPNEARGGVVVEMKMDIPADVPVEAPAAPEPVVPVAPAAPVAPAVQQPQVVATPAIAVITAHAKRAIKYVQHKKDAALAIFGGFAVASQTWVYLKAEGIGMALAPTGIFGFGLYGILGARVLHMIMSGEMGDFEENYMDSMRNESWLWTILNLPIHLVSQIFDSDKGLETGYSYYSWLAWTSKPLASVAKSGLMYLGGLMSGYVDDYNQRGKDLSAINRFMENVANPQLDEIKGIYADLANYKDQEQRIIKDVIDQKSISETDKVILEALLRNNQLDKWKAHNPVSDFTMVLTLTPGVNVYGAVYNDLAGLIADYNQLSNVQDVAVLTRMLSEIKLKAQQLKNQYGVAGNMNELFDKTIHTVPVVKGWIESITDYFTNVAQDVIEPLFVFLEGYGDMAVQSFLCWMCEIALWAVVNAISAGTLSFPTLAKFLSGFIFGIAVNEIQNITGYKIPTVSLSILWSFMNFMFFQKWGKRTAPPYKFNPDGTGPLSAGQTIETYIDKAFRVYQGSPEFEESAKLFPDLKMHEDWAKNAFLARPLWGTASQKPIGTMADWTAAIISDKSHASAVGIESLNARNSFFMMEAAKVASGITTVENVHYSSQAVKIPQYSVHVSADDVPVDSGKITHQGQGLGIDKSRMGEIEAIKTFNTQAKRLGGETKHLKWKPAWHKGDQGSKNGIPRSATDIQLEDLNIEFGETQPETYDRWLGEKNARLSRSSLPPDPTDKWDFDKTPVSEETKVKVTEAYQETAKRLDKDWKRERGEVKTEAKAEPIPEIPPIPPPSELPPIEGGKGGFFDKIVSAIAWGLKHIIPWLKKTSIWAITTAADLLLKDFVLRLYEWIKAYLRPSYQKMKRSLIGWSIRDNEGFNINDEKIDRARLEEVFHTYIEKDNYFSDPTKAMLFQVDNDTNVDYVESLEYLCLETAMDQCIKNGKRIAAELEAKDIFSRERPGQPEPELNPKEQTDLYHFLRSDEKIENKDIAEASNRLYHIDADQKKPVSAYEFKGGEKNEYFLISLTDRNQRPDQRTTHYLKMLRSTVDANYQANLVEMDRFIKQIDENQKTISDAEKERNEQVGNFITGKIPGQALDPEATKTVRDYIDSGETLIAMNAFYELVQTKKEQYDMEQSDPKPVIAAGIATSALATAAVYATACAINRIMRR